MNRHNTTIATILAVASVYPKMGLTVTQCVNDGKFHREGIIVNCKVQEELGPLAHEDYVKLRVIPANKGAMPVDAKCTNVVLMMGGSHPHYLEDLIFRGNDLYSYTKGLPWDVSTYRTSLSMDCNPTRGGDR